MSFHPTAVWFLLLLLLVPLVWWRWLSRRRRASVAYSSLTGLRSAGATWAVRARWIVPLLRTVAVVLLIVCMARPRIANQQTSVSSEGIAIELVVDRSGSMRAMDFRLNGRDVTRLEVVQDVVNQFVTGGDDLAGRPNDLIGLIAFGTYADSVCPITLDHEHLTRTVEAVRAARDQSESATAIGDAIALGVERLTNLERRESVVARSTVESKVMILLTDGENNAGDIDPLTAADMAAALGIRIYTIGAGSDDGIARMPVVDPFGNERMQSVRVSIDEKTLEAIAERTGGAYFRATDTDSLRDVYARIDELERTEVEERRYLEYHELAVQPVTVAGMTLPPLLAVVLGLVALESLLSRTRLRTLPG